ncbi:MAG: DUF4013 domain-containing protein [Deltaproteobacteria bacterium]|nr:DUF4013 domain-containing protein [Candidatus Zymogenaceae bacterium]
MIDLKKAITYPFDDEQWPRKLLIGFALFLVPIVNFFVVGYAYRIFKTALRKEDLSLPEWDNWKDLFVNGFKVCVIILCYFFIPLVFRIVTVILVREGASAIILLIFILLAGLLHFAAMACSSMALTFFAKSDERFKEAFWLEEIVYHIRNVLGDFFIAFLIIFAIHFFMLLFNIIPFLGLIIYIMTLFYLICLVCPGIFGSICAEIFEDVEILQETTQPPWL